MAVISVGFVSAPFSAPLGPQSFDLPIPTVRAEHGGLVLPDDQIAWYLIQRGGTSASVTTPGGWVPVLRTDAGANLAAHTLRKTAAGGESGTVAVAMDSTGAHRLVLVGEVLRGVDPAAPVDAALGATPGAVTTVPAPTLNTTVAGCRITRVHGQRNNDTNIHTWAPGTGLTELDEDTTAVASPNVSGTAGHDTADLAAAGPTGTRDSIVSGGTPVVTVAQTIAWAPLVVVGGQWPPPQLAAFRSFF